MNSKLRIALTTPGYPVGGGGVSTYVHDMAHALAAQEHTVHVLVPTQGKTSSSKDHLLNVHRVHVASWRARGWGCGVLGLYANTLLRSYRLTRALLDLQRSDGLDIIEFPDFGAHGVLYSIVSSVGRVAPYVVKIHTPSAIAHSINTGHTNLVMRILDVIECWPPNHALCVTTPSMFMAQQCQSHKRLRGINPIVVPNPIDTKIWAPASDKSVRPLSILYTGHTEFLKGTDVLLEAIPLVWRRLPRTRFNLVGAANLRKATGLFSDAMQKRLDEISRSRRVNITDWQPRDRLVAMYQDSDVGVIPSRYDNFPYSCLESMACGLATVASAVGGIPEIIGSEGAGVLVPPGDPATLADALIALGLDPECRRGIARGGRERVARLFAPSVIAQETVEVYQIALDGRHR